MRRKILSLSVLLVVALTLVFPSAATAAQPLSVDPKVPVAAADVEVGHKVHMKGVEKAGKPPKPAPTGAATGILGVEASGTKYAIVIGISDYPGMVNDLSYCDEDADDMVAALGLYGYAASNIATIKDSDATREAIMLAIANMASKVDPGDEVVFFFSGHGGRGKANDWDREVTDECIWSHDDSKLVPIWDGELKAAFSAFDTSRIIFIFDSCYAGGMTDLAGEGRIVAMASTENTLSAEYSSLQNGEFTYWMIDKGMISYLGDKFDSLSGHDVTVEEAWDYARLNCKYDSVTISDRFVNDLLP